MKLKIIQTEEEYTEALARVETLMAASPSRRGDIRSPGPWRANESRLASSHWHFMGRVTGVSPLLRPNAFR
jgi:hypothetical protein